MPILEQHLLAGSVTRGTDTGPGSPASSKRSAVAVVVLAAALAGTFALGRHSAPHASVTGVGRTVSGPALVRTARDQPAAAPAAPRQTSTAATVPGPLADHSAGGAAGAAADIFSSLGSPDLFDPTKASTLLAGLAASDADPSLAQIAAPVSPSSDSAGVTAARAAGQPIIARNLIAAWRTTAYTAGTATVQLWVDGLLGTPTLGEVRSSWETATVGLEWTPSGWRLKTLAATAGPAPTPADSTFTSYSDAVNATAGMRGWTYAPGS